MAGWNILKIGKGNNKIMKYGQHTDTVNFCSFQRLLDTINNHARESFGLMKGEMIVGIDIEERDNGMFFLIKRN